MPPRRACVGKKLELGAEQGFEPRRSGITVEGMRVFTVGKSRESCGVESHLRLHKHVLFVFNLKMCLLGCIH